MGLHIEIGHPVTKDVKLIEGKLVRFADENGRTMFEVSIRPDGRSLDVRAVEVTKHDGELYESTLEIRPAAANCVRISTPRYDS
ncbi:hypothetical protein [Pseudorhodoferax sp. Leaf274]|uniref:hypothetical protein n=1 Tax=Pseudorhodoferax sp. Leaf274 TaxID=1736318 RepID=UPI0007028DA5|nr:hypothetical protein [Pseudorhodoferax sp. Leaf274]KQP36109.1 hypothetical protein ASF44_16195 [Pseudorhodoferax sp. Leaf274]